MYISLYDLGMFIIFIIIIIVSGYLIAILHRGFSMIGHLRDIIATRSDDISQIIAGLPIALTSVNELAVSLKETVDQTTSAVESIQDNVTDTVDELRYGLGNFFLYVKVIGDIIKAIFSKSK